MGQLQTRRPLGPSSALLSGVGGYLDTMNVSVAVFANTIHASVAEYVRRWDVAMEMLKRWDTTRHSASASGYSIVVERIYTVLP